MITRRARQRLAAAPLLSVKIKSMNDILKKTLYGGPCDGQVIEIHKDSLKIKPRMTVKDKDGLEFVYGLDNKDEFVWLPNPDDPKVARGWFVCDDDGNVISEEKNIEDARRKLDEFNDDSENWKFKS